MCRPVYGELGFNNSQDINKKASDIHVHNDPVDPEVYKQEVQPWQAQLEAFFRPTLRDLQHILGGYANQQIEQSLQKQQKNTNNSYFSSLHPARFIKLESLAKANTGSWSDIVELLSVFHGTEF